MSYGLYDNDGKEILELPQYQLLPPPLELIPDHFFPAVFFLNPSQKKGRERDVIGAQKQYTKQQSRTKDRKEGQQKWRDSGREKRGRDLK